MKREELIKKWLDHNLSTEERKAFEQLEDYNDLIQIDDALQSFRSPEFSVSDNYQDLKPEIKSTNTKNSRIAWYKPLLRAAAILAICLVFTTIQLR